MRRTVGLLSLTLASGLGVGASGSAWAHGRAPHPALAGDRQDRTGRRRARRGARTAQPAGVEAARLRQEALTDVIDGAATAQQRNGSTVVEVGRSAASHPSDKHSREAAGDTSHGATGRSTSSWHGRRPTRSS